jgi:hypothetical protein
MKTKIELIAALCAVSTVALASPKSDYFAAIQACAAAYPPPVTDQRIACDLAAMVVYQAAIAAPAQPASQSPAVKSTK